ncbi:hypothetical protein M407DRAFT_245771, partial [Tulasnella calospora MUT 4182]
MYIEHPPIPTALRYKGLKTVVQATAEDIGRAVEILDAAQRACLETPRPEPKITVEDLGKLSIYRHRLETNHAEHHYPRDRENAITLSKLEDLTTMMEGLVRQVSDLKETVDKLASLPQQVRDLETLPASVETLSTDFGTFAIPIVQRHNAGCTRGINFQRVPFPSGKWPD